MDVDVYDENDVIWIETSQGDRFMFDDPVWDIEEIAHSLGMNCRYNGHCKRFYSVAEHSCMVSDLLIQWDRYDLAMGGLLHDGSESILTDVPSPVKPRLPDWKKEDVRLEESLNKYFRIDFPRPQLNIKADRIALFIEAYDLMPSQGRGWKDPEGLRETALGYRINNEFKVKCWSPKKAKKEFLKRYDLLAPGHYALQWSKTQKLRRDTRGKGETS